MENFDNHFKSIIDKFGQPAGGGAVDPAMVETYRDRVPVALTAFWTTYGLGFWREGYFQLCDPRRYRPIAKFVFSEDADFPAQRTHIYGFSAFGRLLAWNETHRLVRVDLLDHSVRCVNYFKPKPNISPNIPILTSLFGADDEADDALDADGEPMFRRAVKTYGPLAMGQIYAPRLNPALGGAMSLDNFRPAAALEAMSLAAQSGPFVLKDVLARPPHVTRQIG